MTTPTHDWREVVPVAQKYPYSSPEEEQYLRATSSFYRNWEDE